MEPNQPAITPAQIGAAIVALIAPTAALLAAFHVVTLTGQQEGAVRDMILALAGLAAVIVAADAHLRAARNKARAAVAASPVPLEPVVGHLAGAADDGETMLADGLPEYATHTGDVPPDQGDAGPAAIGGKP
jgi:hypothetical protein